MLSLFFDIIFLLLLPSNKKNKDKPLIHITILQAINHRMVSSVDVTIKTITLYRLYELWKLSKFIFQLDFWYQSINTFFIHLEFNEIIRRRSYSTIYKSVVDVTYYSESSWGGGGEKNLRNDSCRRNI